MLVVGAMILKHKLNLSDEETILQIQENPYLQYFVGFSSYKDEPPFAPILLVDIRKRMGDEVFLIERAILDKTNKPRQASTVPVENRDKLLVDAPVAEQSIRYPTDLSLLGEAREISEKLIDELYALSDYTKKPRTYRRKARKQYLTLAKNKKPSIKIRRRGLREQLQYLRRNLKDISTSWITWGAHRFLSHTNCNANIQDSRERIPIEGKFGQGKNGYRLNYIRAKLQKPLKHESIVSSWL